LDPKKPTHFWKKLTVLNSIFRSTAPHTKKFFPFPNLSNKFPQAKMSSPVSSPPLAQPHGGSPVPPAEEPAIRTPSTPPQPPAHTKSLIHRADSQRLIQNIVLARTTTYADELESCLDHAYFIIDSMHRSNHILNRPTAIFSEMLKIIDTTRLTIGEYYAGDADDIESGSLFVYVTPHIMNLDSKYAELVYHLAEFHSEPAN
jgi:hypothetical protein